MSQQVPAMMIAGGRPRDPTAMARMMAQALAGVHEPEVAYIGTANNDNPAFFQMMKATLKNAGAADVVPVKLAKKNPDVEKSRKILESADIIFLSGGEVEDGMIWLEKCGMTGFLKNLYAEGKRFMGVSAGVIMMGSHWVHWDKEGDDSTARLFDCLKLTPVLFDVHGEDEDWPELKTAIRLLGDGAQGFGLPGGCMVSADSSGRLVNLEKEYLVYRNENGVIRRI
ncbi:MAG: Type 1 glutamine amidotransferase-like domain-containing protein [Treponema sp.]|nr:Type 1 glutamine amidotransferase-like domain-containing protein [Treponema sp.]